MIAVSDVLTEARRAMDEYTLSGTMIAFDSDIEDTVSSNFSDEDLRDRALDGARYIAARVKAAHLQELVATINLTDPDALAPVGDGGAGATDWPFLRILGSRVDFNSAGADRRTMSGHLAATGMAATDAAPVYVYEDYEFILAKTAGDETSDPGTAGGVANVNVSAVMVPTFVVSVGPIVQDTYDGISWSGTLNLPLDAKFTAAIVYYVVSSCFQTLRQPEIAIQYRKDLFSEIAPYMLSRFSQKDLEKPEQV